MGVRTEEMKRMKRTHIRYGTSDRYVAIDETVGKKRHIRNIDYTETFRLWVIGYPFENHKMWKKGADEYISKTNLRHRIEKLHVLANVPFKKNALRHSFASYHYVDTGSIDLTRERLGHDSQGVIYAHYLQLTDKTRARQFWDILPPYLLDEESMEQKQQDVEYTYRPKDRDIPPVPPRREHKEKRAPDGPGRIPLDELVFPGPNLPGIPPLPIPRP